MNNPYLTIIGIGEDGIKGLSTEAKQHLSNADIVFGGERHLTLGKEFIRGEIHPWVYPLDHSIEQIKQSYPNKTVVLASGDPFWYGIGSIIAQSLPRHQWQSFPALSCYSLACNRLGWFGQYIETVSLCGRPLSTLRPALTPNKKLFILSADQYTPHLICKALKEWQIQFDHFYVLEALGGPKEKIYQFSFNDVIPKQVHPLNMVAIELARFQPLPFVHGREDQWFKNDGQLTKQPVRASTLSLLQPYPNAILWDIGAGSGSIAIEWMLTHPQCIAYAIEPREDRFQIIQENAQNLGVPNLNIIYGKAPDSLTNLPNPDAVFIGGGLTEPNLIEEIWHRINSYGRLVINSVTVEGDNILYSLQKKWGGKIIRLQAEYYEPIGRFNGFKPARAITQYAVTHP